MFMPADTHSAEQQSPSLVVALRQRWWLPLLVALLAAVGAYLLTARSPASYSSSALIQFSEGDLDEQIISGFYDSRDPEEVAATNVVLVGRRSVAAQAAQRLGGGWTADTLLDATAVSREDLTSIVRVSAASTSPAAAARIANTYAQTYIDLDREEQRRRIEEAARIVQSQIDALPTSQRDSARGLSLNDRLTQLELLLQTPSARVKLVQAATEATEASSAPPLRNGVLAGLLGLAFGIGLVALRDQADRRVRTESELERAYGAPLLASVPRSRALRTGHQFLGDLPPGDAEVFRLLQAQLRYATEPDSPSVVVITSATNSEGKTTTAWHLAAAAAATGRRVLLLEADMRRPAFASRFGLESEDGLVDLLTHSIELPQATQRVEVASGRYLDVVVAGGIPENPADLSQSAAVVDVVRRARAEYDLVVIDTPPLSVVSDAIPFAKVADGAIVVSHKASVKPAQVNRLREQLRALDVRLLGIVANGYEAERESSYAYY
jgi:capsular exopolysaccharide synthesis family protein